MLYIEAEAGAGQPNTKSARRFAYHLLIVRLNALKFQCAQRDSLSEMFLLCMPNNQCKGKSLRGSERFYFALTRIKASNKH